MVNIKIIIDDGIVRAVLKDRNDAVMVELIDTSICYENYEAQEKYAMSIMNDSKYTECDYRVVNLDDDHDAAVDCDGECVGCDRACADRIINSQE